MYYAGRGRGQNTDRGIANRPPEGSVRSIQPMPMTEQAPAYIQPQVGGVWQKGMNEGIGDYGVLEEGMDGEEMGPPEGVDEEGEEEMEPEELDQGQEYPGTVCGYISVASFFSLLL